MHAREDRYQLSSRQLVGCTRPEGSYRCFAEVAKVAITSVAIATGIGHFEGQLQCNQVTSGAICTGEVENSRGLAMPLFDCDFLS